MNTTYLWKAAGSMLFIAAAIAAADPTYALAGDVEIKRGGKDIRRPAVSLFAPAKKQATEKVACGGCRNDLTPVRTQDTKLKMKTLLVENHACTSCKTSVADLGPKGNRSSVINHSCLAVASGKCCN